MHRLRWFAAVAAFALAAGSITAYASIPDSGGTIHSCYSQATGTWRPIDTETTPPDMCKRGEKELDWNTQGPAGQPGADGVENAYFTSMDDHVDLPAGGFTTVLTLDLPAGSYAISSETNLGNFSGERVPVLCAIYAPNGALNTIIQIAGIASFPGAGGDATTLNGSALITLPQPDTVKLQCESNTGDGAQAFVEGRQLTALSVSHVNVQ